MEIFLATIILLVGDKVYQSRADPCETPLNMYEKNTVHFNLTYDGNFRYVFQSKFEQCSVDLAAIYLSMSDMFTEMELNKPLFIGLQLLCRKPPVELKFRGMETKQHQKFHFYIHLKISQCTVSTHDLSLLSNFGKIIWLYADNLNIKLSNDTDCLFTDDLRVLSQEIGCDQHFIWENCSHIFKNVITLYLRGCDDNFRILKAESLKEKFPNLQSIDLTLITLSEPLLFPWTSNFTKFHLTQFVNKQVNTSDTRSFSLDHSDTNLTNLQFSGDLDNLKLSHIHLSRLRANILHNATVYRNIDFSFNNLRKIDKLTFVGQVFVMNLHLDNNKISSLHPDIFKDLTNLRVLYLSHNNIETLDRGLFKSLTRLNELHLEFNNIHNLSRDMFKEQLNSLKTLYLGYNPLSSIPVWPLYGKHVNSISLKATRINGESILSLVREVNVLDIMASSAHSSVIDSVFSGLNPTYLRRDLDLSLCRISTVPNENVTDNVILNCIILMRMYIWNMAENPIICNCGIETLQEILSAFTRYATSRIVSKWICVYPAEFKGRNVLSIHKSEMYCPITIQACPQNCSCFQRITSRSIIIDCRYSALHSLPEMLPPRPLELWFHNNSLTNITSKVYFQNITYLDLSENKIHFIDPRVFSTLQSVETFTLASNHLTNIPVQMKTINASMILLGNNPFVCDCNTRWMKTWLLSKENQVKDWLQIMCTNNSKKIVQLIAVPDDSFVCHSDIYIYSIHIILPSIVTGTILFVIIVISLLIYFQRFTVKVLLHLYFGIHPFDRSIASEFQYDACIVYNNLDKDAFYKEITENLKKFNYKFADLYNDVLIGFSFIENIERLIKKSNRMIFYLTENSIEDQLVLAAWNIAYSRAKKTTLKSIILITDSQYLKLCKQENLIKFLKTKCYINRKSKLLKESVVYMMPRPKKENTRENNGDNNAIQMHYRTEQDGDFKGIVFILYPDNCHDYVRNEVMPFLKNNQYDARFLDMEIPAGEYVPEVLVDTLNKATHFVFILSQEVLTDELKVLILSEAILKTKQTNYNYLLLCTNGEIFVNTMGNEVSGYIKNYVTTSIQRPNFNEQLLESLEYRLDMDHDHIEHTPENLANMDNQVPLLD